MTTPQVAHPTGVRTTWAALACAAVVAVLGTGVALSWAPQLGWDAAVSRALYAGDDRSAWTSGLLETLTAPGLSVVRWLVFAPVVVLLLRAGRGRVAAWVTISVVGVGPVNAGLKELFGRVRPGFAEGGAQYGSLSFPSGHSAGVACLVTTALLLAGPRLAPVARRWWTAAGVVLVLLVGCTRMWLGVHYLSDVLAGWAVGVGWTLLVAGWGARWTRG